jgi:hypothetical protein
MPGRYVGTKNLRLLEKNETDVIAAIADDSADTAYNMRTASMSNMASC